MKSFALVAFVCIAVVYAASDLSSLVERATELEATAQKVVAEYKNQSASHLLSALEHEVKQLEELAAEVKGFAESNTTVRTHELNELEEQLLHHENRVNEEIDFINAAFAIKEATKSNNELLAFGKKLVEEALVVLNMHTSMGHDDIHALENEVHEVEKLMEKLEKHLAKSHGNINDHAVIEDEVALIKHELTVRILTERIQNGHNHRN